MNNNYSKFYSKPLIFKLMYYTIAMPLAVIIGLLPRKKGLVIFGSMNGFDIADNSKYKFINEYSDNKYFITKNKSKLKKPILDDVYPIYSLSLFGIYLQIRAERVYYTHSIFDFSAMLISGAKKTALWHGVAIKEIGPYADWKALPTPLLHLRRCLAKIFQYNYYMNCDEVICPFPELEEDYKRYFSVSKPKLLFTPQPRTLYAPKLPKTRSILYAPTFRPVNDKSDCFSQLLKNINLFAPEVSNFLFTNSLKLVIRPHPIDKEYIQNIKLPEHMYVDSTGDLYSSINSYMLVITDFSSIYYDCLSLGIKCLLLAPDLEEYDKEVGLSSAYKETFQKTGFRTFTELIRACHMNSPTTNVIPSGGGMQTFERHHMNSVKD